jgi:hypothetical protein
MAHPRLVYFKIARLICMAKAESGKPSRQTAFRFESQADNLFEKLRDP